jgi:hypothetical protein
MKTDLITVPTFVFHQGDLGDETFEMPIHVDFYNGTIVLRQKGDYDTLEEIKIAPENLDALFKEIKRHKPSAEQIMKHHH